MICSKKSAKIRVVIYKTAFIWHKLPNFESYLQKLAKKI